MKKGGLFSGSLYREGLRQTRALGWTLFGLSLGGLLMGFVMQFGVALTSPSATQTPSIVDLYDGAPLLFLLFIWAPILVLVLFNLVTRRNQCDFYHALPHTRVQLAGSYLAAALTWTLGSLLASFGLFVILYSCLPDTLAIVNLTGALHSLVSSTVLVLLITGGTFLAVSLTGTMVSAMLGTGLILFMPRILLGIITTQMVSAAPIVSVDDLPFPLSSVNLLANYFSRSHASVMHAPLTTLLYTFLLGALYFGLGLWAFSRRKSERAGSAAISHGAQAIFRVLIAAPILLGAAVLVINTFVIHPEEWGELSYSIAFATLSSAFTLLGVSLGVFVLYELFTTRSAKRLLRILPSFGLVIAIALAGAASIVGAKSALTASVPKRDDIKSVSLLPKTDEGLLTSMVSGLFDDSYQNSYYTRLAQNIPTDRESVRTIVAGALQGALASESDDNTYFNNLFAGVSNETRLSVQLKNGQTQTRTLWLSEEQTEAIQSALCLNADYVRAMTQLPDETKDPLVVYAPDQSLTVTQARQVYASLRQEIAEGDPLTWIRVVNSASMYPMSLQMQTIFGSDVVSATLPVTVDYPKTLELYINFARQNVDFEKWLKRYPLTAADVENGSTNIQFSSMDGTLETDGTLDVWMSSDDLDFGDQTITDDWNETVEWIREQVKKPIDVNARYGRVSISTWRWSGAYSSITLFIPMDTVPDALYRLTYNGWHEDEWDDTESDESGEVSESAAPESSAPANDNATTTPTTTAPTTTAPTTTAPTTTVPDDGTASSGDAWALPAVPI